MTVQSKTVPLTRHAARCSDCRCLGVPQGTESEAEYAAIRSGWQVRGWDIVCPTCIARRDTPIHDAIAETDEPVEPWMVEQAR